MNDTHTHRFRRSALAAAMLAALAGGASAQITGTIENLSYPGAGIADGDEIRLDGQAADLQVTNTLAVGEGSGAGLLQVVGTSSLTSTEGSTQVTVDEGQAVLRVLSPAGGENGIVAYQDAAIVSGTGAQGGNTLTVDEDGVRIDGDTGSLAVAGDTVLEGGLAVAGQTILDGGLAVTGNTYLQAADGSAFGGVETGFAALQVVDADGGLNGLAADDTATLLSGGTSSLVLDDAGSAFNGGDFSAVSADGSADVTVQDGFAALRVQGDSGANGIDVNASETTLTGGGADGTTTLRVGAAGLEVIGDGQGASGNLTVSGQTVTAGIENTGPLASTGPASLISTDGTADLAVDDGFAALRVQGDSGANGLDVNASETTLTGGDADGATTVRVSQAGLEVIGDGSEGSGSLAVAGQTILDGGLAVTGNTYLQAADGSAFGGVETGFAALQVVDADGGLNGLAADDTATLLSGGTSSLVLDDAGSAFNGGDFSAVSADGSADVTVQDGFAALRVQGDSGANGIDVNASETTLTGGGADGTTTLRVGAAGLEVIGDGQGASGNLTVSGQTVTAGIENTGPLASTGPASLISTDGTADLAVDDGFAALRVQGDSGANGLDINASETTLTGGDADGATTVRVSQAGLAVIGDGSEGSGSLSVGGSIATHGLTSLGDATLTSADGTASVVVVDGAASLLVDAAGGGERYGISVTRDGTTITGVGPTSVEQDLVVQGTSTLQGATRIDDSLTVIGQTATRGIVNTGSLTNNGDLVNSGNATVGGALFVGGAATLQGATQIDDSLTVTGQTNTRGIANTGALESVGDSTLTSADGTAQVAVANGAASLLVESVTGERYGIAVTPERTVITGADRYDGTAGLVVGDGEAGLVVQNASGGTNGIQIGAEGTTISGGTGTTFIDVTDLGVTIRGTGPSNGDLYVRGTTNLQGGLRVSPNSTVDFGGNRLQNVAPGDAATDAVNRAQLDEVQEEARRGVAIAAALDTMLPDPGKRFRLNLGGGYYNGESAIGLTGAGRIGDDVAVYFGIGSDTSFNETAGKVGVSYQW